MIQLGGTSDTGERVQLIRINTGEKVGFTAVLLNTNTQSINSMTRPSVLESFTLYSGLKVRPSETCLIFFIQILSYFLPNPFFLFKLLEFYFFFSTFCFSGGFFDMLDLFGEGQESF